MTLGAKYANARFLGSTSAFSHYRKKIAVANLFQKYGFPSSLIPSFISRNPSLLHSPLPQLHHSLTTLFSLRIPQNDLVSLLTTNPSLLHHSFHHTLQSRLPHLQTRFPTLSPSTLLNLLLSSTKLHLDPLQLSPKLNALKTDFAFSDATVASILEGFPDVVVTSENEIASVIDFLAGFGIPRDEVDLVVRSFPRVLALSVEQRLMPLFREIKELGFSNREMRIEITRDPRILGMEIGELTRCLRLIESLKCRESIKERVIGSGLMRACFEVKLRVDCLCGYGLTRRDALKVIWKEPRVICYEVGDVERKVEFLVQRMKCSVECLADVPKYLGVNFEKQIVARYSVVECLRGKGAIGFEFGLKDLVMPSRLRFYNLYVKPYPECEKIYGRFSGRGVQVKTKHPAGLWKLFKPQKFAERDEDVKSVRSFMESLV
ncbi:transcription termination factor MTERF15, mitochondrial [Vigna radiata var. radiata]|uniref:Transcription termination factor MTERF15, mitochondrial n=1 Tax=Vigna radiata var. radiata TaxID=3916 RepID=A0A1S3TGX1_VIGRR|nr:transcription termination factor MTERF15, mitochondrial [Vigna radiata var. radiata]